MNYDKNPNQMTTLIGLVRVIQPMEIIKPPWNMLIKLCPLLMLKTKAISKQ
jgi:hypothetical protein